MDFSISDIRRDFNELERRIASFPDKYRSQVEVATMNAMAQTTAKQARRTDQFQDVSGRLRRSIRAATRRIRRRGSPVRTLAVVIAGGPKRGTPYGFFVHQGHRTRSGESTQARPFLLRAVTTVAPRLIHIGRAAAVRRFAGLKAALKPRKNFLQTR